MWQKAKRPKFLMGAIALLIIIICCTFYAIPTRHSGEEIFRVLVFDPIPKSVVILHSQDDETGFDGRIWLHFKISKSDLEFILESKKWVIDPEITSSIDHNNEKLIDWWKPESFSHNFIKFSLILSGDCERKTKESMWVNKEQNEVYVLYENGCIH
jgi:hypothetical protein